MVFNFSIQAGRLDVAVIDKYWSKSNLGYKKFNDHKVYEKDKGANFYMAKYIDKEIDYDYVWGTKQQINNVKKNHIWRNRWNKGG